MRKRTDVLDLIVDAGLADKPAGWLIAAAMPNYQRLGTGRLRVLRAPTVTVIGGPGTGKSSFLQGVLPDIRVVMMEVGNAADTTKVVEGKWMALKMAYVDTLMDAVQDAVTQFETDADGLPMGFVPIVLEELFAAGQGRDTRMLSFLSGTAQLEIREGDLRERLERMHNTGGVPNNVVLYATTNPANVYRLGQSPYRSRIIVVDVESLGFGEFVEAFERGLPVPRLKTNRVSPYVEDNERVMFFEALLGVGSPRQRSYYSTVLNNIHELLKRGGVARGIYDRYKEVAALFRAESADVADTIIKVFSRTTLPTLSDVLNDPSLVAQRNLRGQVAMAYATRIVFNESVTTAMAFVQKLLAINLGSFYYVPILAAMTERAKDLQTNQSVSAHLPDWLKLQMEVHKRTKEEVK